jgi:hypothetical protein
VRAGPWRPEVLDLVVGTGVVEGLVTPGGGAWGQRRGLGKRRVAGAERVLLSVGCVLDGLAPMRVGARTPGVEEGPPVPAAGLETPAPGPTGAGVGGSAQGWLRDTDRDAHARAQTQGLTRS